jgi:hypothetical protein
MWSYLYNNNNQPYLIPDLLDIQQVVGWCYPIFLNKYGKIYFLEPTSMIINEIISDIKVIQLQLINCTLLALSEDLRIYYCPIYSTQLLPIKSLDNYKIVQLSNTTLKNNIDLLSITGCIYKVELELETNFVNHIKIINPDKLLIKSIKLIDNFNMFM